MWKDCKINYIKSEMSMPLLTMLDFHKQVLRPLYECIFNQNGKLCVFKTVISSKPLYLSESPWDSGMSTSVKRAFSTVDSLFCQAGIALRRRPNLRLGFCVYILLLHFWVLFILFHTFNHVSQVDDGPSNGPAPSPI